MKRCMTCYAEEMAELAPERRLGVVLGQYDLARPLVPWDGDCEWDHFAALGREMRGKARRALSGTQKPPRKKAATKKEDDNEKVHDPQGTLFN